MLISGIMYLKARRHLGVPEDAKKLVVSKTPGWRKRALPEAVFCDIHHATIVTAIL